MRVRAISSDSLASADTRSSFIKSPSTNIMLAILSGEPSSAACLSTVASISALIGGSALDCPAIAAT